MAKALEALFFLKAVRCAVNGALTLSRGTKNGKCCFSKKSVRVVSGVRAFVAMAQLLWRIPLLVLIVKNVAAAGNAVQFVQAALVR